MIEFFSQAAMWLTPFIPYILLVLGLIGVLLLVAQLFGRTIVSATKSGR